jgi:hypothetical protein
MSRKRLLAIVAVLLVIYFLFLPPLWPEPTIDVSASSSEATITIHTWHSNIGLFAVDGIFEVDPSRNNGYAVMVVDLLGEPDRTKWDSHIGSRPRISRWTWPRSHDFKFTLPVEELRDKSATNYVKGRIRVRLRYPEVAVQGFTTTHTARHVEDIEIDLQE